MRGGRSGFTLVEMLAAMLIVGILMGIAIPKLFQSLDKTRQARAIVELEYMQQQIEIYRNLKGKVPDQWSDLAAGAIPSDPWGRSYVYNSHGFVSSLLFRTNGPLIPINTDYDLYSMGKDGISLANILLLGSTDDIVRADNGAFFGIVTDY